MNIKQEIEKIKDEMKIFSGKVLVKKEKTIWNFYSDKLDLLIIIDFDMTPNKTFIMTIKKYSTDEIMKKSKMYFNFYEMLFDFLDPFLEENFNN